MLNIGTKVFVKNLYKEDRPESQQNPSYMRCNYGYIAHIADNGYYLVIHEDDMTYHEDEAREYGIYIHEDEMIDMDTYQPKYNTGDKVRICEPTAHEIACYLPGWIYEMRNHIGKVVTIESSSGRPHCYRVKENLWVWEDVNLEPLSEFIGY